MSHYSRPTLTDLGQVEDLTRSTIQIKFSTPGIDVHFSKNGVDIQKNQPSTGITIENS